MGFGGYEFGWLDYLPPARDRWAGKKRRVGRGEGIVKGGYYGKTTLRLYHRSKNQQMEPAKPTKSTVTSGDGRTQWRSLSDGSYRRIKAAEGRRLIAVD